MSQTNNDNELFFQNFQELNSNLVFAKFGKLAKKKDILYSNFIEIDEPDEIGTTWVDFSSEVVLDLLDVVKLTKSLFERLVDELRRGQDDPSPDELNRIKNLTGFWLDISVISYLYGTIEKRGVLDQKGKDKYSMGYVNTKKSLDELTLLAFQAGQEFFELDSRITLGEALSLNMEKKRLDFIDDVGEGDDLRNEILGEYDKDQAMFLLTRVFTRLLQSADTWWFLDAIALHSASEHAIAHITSMKENWSKCSSDLVEKGNRHFENQVPIAKLSSKVALAQHYRRLAIAALLARSNEIASEYFGEAEKLTSTVELANMKKVDAFGIWNRTIPEQYLIYSQMKHLSLISSKYDDIMDAIESNNIEFLNETIPKLLEKLSAILSEGDIAYVSSVALAYETIFAYINEEMKGKFDTKKVGEFVKTRIDTIAIRLHKASHQMVKNWTEVVRNDPSNVEVLEDLIANIDYPLMAILVLPPNSKIVSSASRELMSIQNVTEALSVSISAENEFGKNPVKEMLMRAKTFEITKQALDSISSVADSETKKAVRTVLNPVARNAFLRGLIAEIQLRTAVLQYEYINRIAPIIEHSSLNTIEENGPLAHDKEELNNFLSSLEELKIAAEEVDKYRSPINIGGAPLNWKYITKLFHYSSGLVKIVKAINFAIEAATFGKSDVDDAVYNWDEAKTLTFAAADDISKAATPEAENLSQQVYTLAQIFYEFENKRRDRQDTEDFPVEGIVELVSTLLMGL